MSKRSRRPRLIHILPPPTFEIVETQHKRKFGASACEMNRTILNAAYGSNVAIAGGPKMMLCLRVPEKRRKEERL